MSLSMQTPPITPPKTDSAAVKPATLPPPPFSLDGHTENALSTSSKARLDRLPFGDGDDTDEEEYFDLRANGAKKPNPVSMLENPFDNEQSRIMFEAIDQLHSLGPNDLDPPQLVIVGGQSAGKSSLLQTLTGIPFPVDSGCCTRFPTRIVSKRTPGAEESYHVSITPAEVDVKGVHPAPKACLNYKRTGETLTADMFVQIMEEVSAQLQIRRGVGSDKRNFASEVLRVELKGPNRSYFEILDLPGQFGFAAEVNRGDPKAIDNMIIAYLRKKANIAVCVADAATDIAHQRTVEFVGKYANKEQAIGVFTKCDMIKESSSGAKMCVDIGRGERSTGETKLPNGWFFVKNSLPGDSEDGALAEEELFSVGPWTRVPKERLGSRALKNYLSTVLNSKIRDCFPHLRQKIQDRLDTRQNELDILGDPRDSLPSKRAWVTRIAHAYKDKVESCLNCGRNGYQREDLRVLSKQNKADDAFWSIMREHGGSWNFEADGPEASNEAVAQKEPQSSWVGTAYSIVPEAKSSSDFVSSIEKHLEDFSVMQLPGIVNPELYYMMYKLQVEKWVHIVGLFLHQSYAIVEDFMKRSLDEVCSEKGTTRRLHEQLDAAMLDKLNEAKHKLEVKCKETCDMYTAYGRLHTKLPKSFATTLEWRRRARYMEGVKKWGSWGQELTAAERQFYEQQLFDKTHWTLGENMIYDVHDVVKGYYEIQVEAFMKEISMFVWGFVEGQGSPSRWLNPEYVINLPDDEIASMGSEDESTSKRRDELRQEIETMKGALEIVNVAADKTRAMN